MDTQSVFTDLEMTHFIAHHVKGGIKAQKKIKDEWLDYTEQAYEMKYDLFIETVNLWLRRHKIPCQVIDFNLIDPDINGTSWTIKHI